MPNEDLIKRIEALENTILSLENASQVDPQIARTITQLLSSTTSKTSASATQAVSEGGGASYSVMKPPDGFISIGGKNVPYID